MLSANTSCEACAFSFVASRQAVCLAAQALRFVVRDMGNGVSRLEHPRLESAPLCDLPSPDWQALALPYPRRIVELAGDALAALSVPRPGILPLLHDAMVRIVDERAIEVLGWLLD